MIDNVINIIEGVKNNVDLEVLLKRSDPLGYFPELKNIRTVEGEDYANLYQTVLIDLPIGSYFRKFLEDLLVDEPNKDANRIPDIMRDFKPEKIKNILKKIWITEFYNFCMTEINGTSRDIMKDLLMFESDLMTIQVISNTIGNKDLAGAKGKWGDRRKFINNIGYLYPTQDLPITHADNFEKLQMAVKPFDDYYKMVSSCSVIGEDGGNEFTSSEKTLDDIMFKAKSDKFSAAFEDQFHYAVFYAYLRLKEQEVKNILWLNELVSLNVPKEAAAWKKYVVPFDYMADEQ